MKNMFKILSCMVFLSLMGCASIYNAEPNLIPNSSENGNLLGIGQSIVPVQETLNNNGALAVTSFNNQE